MPTRIKEMRAARNMTQQALADLVGVRRETIVFMERGRYMPSLKLAYEVARVFDVTIEDIFIFENSPPSQAARKSQ